MAMHGFFAAVLPRKHFWKQRLRRDQRDCGLPSGAVKKFVVLDGRWKDRRWNDRWLEADPTGATGDPPIPTEICYYSEDRRKLINRIICRDITSIRAIGEEIETQNSFKSETIIQSQVISGIHDKQASQDSLLWSVVLNNCENLEELQFSFLISTDPKGGNRGKEYLFKTNSADEMRAWVTLINRIMSLNSMPTQRFSQIRQTLRRAYKSNPFQIGVALMIYINFATNIVAVQINPDPGEDSGQVLAVFDLVLSILFAVELGINICTSKFFSEFCTDYWNWCGIFFSRFQCSCC
jgi:hypothetical protein